jgi:NADH-quinone oxidoreductase subunit J
METVDTVAILFVVFSLSTLGSALRVITARNPVHAVLYLVLAFFSAACLWMLLQAEFLAIALVLVYVGAVMVLFLFVVMMLDIRIDRLRAGFWRHLPLAAGIGVAIALQLWLVLANGHWQLLTPPAGPKGAAPNTQALGQLAFTEYLLPLQLAGAILLVAIVAAIALTLRRREDARRQRPGEQVRVRARDRVRLVSMPAAKRAEEPAPVSEE